MLSSPTLPGDEAVIHIEDFGTWSGAHPKKLLEEVASTLISRNGLKIRPLSTNLFSSRMELSVKWSRSLKLDSIDLESLYPGIKTKLTHTSCSLQMKTVATMSPQQSEALLATLTLFLLVSNEKTNTKIVQRLPKVWRDLVSNLEMQRMEIMDRLLEDCDRMALRAQRLVSNSPFYVNLLDSISSILIHALIRVMEIMQGQIIELDIFLQYILFLNFE